MIVVNLDVMMAKRKIGLGELAEKVDITMANLSVLKNNKARAVRFSTLDALCRGRYVLPDTVAAVPEAREAYESAFREQSAFAREMVARGLAMEDAAYCALSGHTADILFSMNARELAHFFRLRTCERAQWEIRAVAWRMLGLLRARCAELFDECGPSCLVTGRCPEGRLSCGRPYRKGETRR